MFVHYHPPLLVYMQIATGPLMSRVFIVLLIATTISLCTSSLEAQQHSPAEFAWPQWRGPSRDGQVSGTDWPKTLSESSLKKLWSVPLGPSYSGPIVSDKMVFTTETRDQKEEAATAFDRQSGEQVWQTNWQGAMKVPFFASANGSWIRSTPAYDGERLYVAGMRDVLVCLDATTGDELWRVDFVEKFGTSLPSFGFVCSPLIDGQAVYVQAAASVVKLDKLTGEVVWRAMNDGGGMFGSAFSSPSIGTIDGVRQLLVQSRKVLAGVSLETGDVLWQQEVPAFRGMNILTPLQFEDGIFTSTYQNGSWLYQIAKQSGEYAVSEAWSNNAQGYMSTPVLIDGHVYLHLENQRFTCIDLASGERTWTSKPYAKYASLVAQGDRILSLNSNGRLLLLRANPGEFEVLGEARVSDEDTWAHLAVSGDEIYVRELNALSAFRWETGQ